MVQLFFPTKFRHFSRSHSSGCISSRSLSPYALGNHNFSYKESEMGGPCNTYSTNRSNCQSKTSFLASPGFSSGGRFRFMPALSTSPLAAAASASSFSRIEIGRGNWEPAIYFVRHERVVRKGYFSLFAGMYHAEIIIGLRFPRTIIKDKGQYPRLLPL